MSTSKKTPRIGRPPRTDDPVKVMVLLPRKVRHRLQLWAVFEQRSQGDVIADALREYWRTAKKSERLAKANALRRAIMGELEPSPRKRSKP